MTRPSLTNGLRRRRRARTADQKSPRSTSVAPKAKSQVRRKKIAPGFTTAPVRSISATLTKANRAYDALVGRHRKRVRKALARIKCHHDRGDQRRVRQLERNHLHAHSFKVVAAARARVRMAWLARQAAREKGTYDPSRRYGPSRQQALCVADVIDLWRTTDEEVKVRKEEKNKGGYRPIHGFGLEHRARQEMLRMTKANTAVLHPAQYAPAKGLKQAQRDILAALRTGEYHYAVTIDVKSYFNNIDVRELPELLRLPTEVITANVDSSSFNIDPRRLRAITEEINKYECMNDDTDRNDSYTCERVIGHRISYRQYQGTPGISQGSSCSPIIAEIVMADILSHLPEGMRVFNWADDILILATTIEEAERAIDALDAAIVAARGGRFQAKLEIHSVDAGFDFIGSTFKGRGPSATVSPTTANRQRLDAAMARHLYKISREGANPDLAIKSIAGWVDANSLWSEAIATQQHYMNEIKRALTQYAKLFHGQTPERRGENEYHLRRMGRAFPRLRTH